MFNFRHSYVNAVELPKLQARVTELENANNSLQSQLEAANATIATINNEVTSLAPAIDFDTMRVFSIERLINNNKPCTIIGYYINEPIVSADGEMIVDRDVVKEWTLHCNNDRHQELVTQFNIWRAKRYG